MSRVKKIIQNAKINTAFYLISIPIYFFSRSYFLKYLGDEFMGLSGTLQSFLGFLNIAELGIGTAIGYAIYKPLFKNDYQEINNIISLFGHLYKRIGVVILFAGIILSLFFPIIFKDLTLSLGVVYFLFYAYLLTSLLRYFYNYNILLIQADQKSYINTTYFVSINLSKVILQTLIAYYLQSYFVWIALDIVFSIAYSVFIKRKLTKEYPWLSNNPDRKYLIKKYPQIILKIKQISVHKLSSFVLTGTDQILIFSFVNIQSVAFFGNYQLILSNFSSLLSNFFSGIGAGVGNLVAEDNKRQINDVFWQMMALSFFVAGFTFIILFYTIEPFITIWIGDSYILGKNILILMLVNLFIAQIRGTVESFIQAYGLFGDTWAPITESILNLVISIILVQFWGISGIMLGTSISLISIVLLWKPYYLFKNGFNKNVFEYWLGFSKLLAVFIATFLFTTIIKDKFIYLEEHNFLSLIFFGIKICLLTVIIYGIFLFLTNNSFRQVLKRMLNLVLKK